MEIMQLCSVLQASLSPDTAQRKAAETALQQHAHLPGQLTNLLRVAVEGTLDVSVRQVAAITLKNLVKTRWDPDDADSPDIAEEDKASVRDNLLEGIVRAPPAVRSQLGESAKHVVHFEFPDRWPALMPAVCTLLTTQDEAQLYAALFMLRLVARKYEFKDEEDRGPLEAVVAATFPRLVLILQHLLALGSASPDVGELVKLILKTFWSATYMYIPAPLAHPQQFAPWMTALHTFILAPVPTEGEPEGSLRASWSWWKAKKWALHISHRLFNRYGDPKHCRDRAVDSAFATQFRDQCSLKFLEAHMALVGRYAEGKWLSPRVVNLALQYLTVAVKAARTWKVLQPHVPQLMARVLFPLMCFDDDDAELWEDDPQEYIRKGYDITEEMYSPKSAASNFLHELCEARGKNMVPFMEQVTAIFAQYQQAAAAGQVPEDVARRMDGALLSIGALSDILKSKAAYKGQLEGMLAAHVVPLFASSHGHLRAKACWLGGVFSDTKFAAGHGSGPTFQALFKANVALLADPDLPVRVGAVMAARQFIDAYDTDEVDQIKPLIPSLLDEIFKLMQEVDNEDLVLTLEAIVEKFEDEMAPFALGLTQHLAAAFWRALEAEEAADGGDDGLAAFNTIRTMCTVLDSVSQQPALVAQLEDVCFPILQKMISENGQDVFEEVLELLAYFTYCTPAISPRLWSLWEPMAACLNEWAIDFFESVLVALDNYISRGTDHFLTCKQPDYLALANQMAEKALTDDNLEEEDVCCAAKLLEIILQNCRGRIDACVPGYLALVLRRLPTARKKLFQDLLLNVVASAFHYNAQLTMSALVSAGAVGGAFTAWLAGIHGRGKRFRRLYDKKVQVLGLLAVASLPEEQLPPEVAAGLPDILAAVLKLLIALREQEALQEVESSSDGSVEDSDSDEDQEGANLVEEIRARGTQGDDDGGLGDDEDEKEDHGYLERLARARARAKETEGREHEESDGESDWTEDEEEQTPIDPLDPFRALAATVHLLQHRASPRFQAFAAGLSPQQTAELQGLLRHAAERPAYEPPADRPLPNAHSL